MVTEGSETIWGSWSGGVGYEVFPFGVIALGTGLALLPETAFTFAASKVPAAVPVTTSLLLLLMIVATPVRAQDSQTVQAVQRSALERRLEGEIVCTCGCRRSLANCGMPTST